MIVHSKDNPNLLFVAKEIAKIEETINFED